MLYRVPLKITFGGWAIVEAENESEAEVRACLHINSQLGDVRADGIDKIPDYEFTLKGITEIRDDESVEEVDE